MSVDFNLLTSKQRKVYAVIETFIKSKGIPPTVREIGEMIGEKTPGAVQGILNRLVQKGVIKRESGMARSIQLITDDSFYEKVSYIPEIKKISRRNIDDFLNVYNIKKYQPISQGILPSSDGCFMINCPDNSLSESDIKYEDLLVLCRNFNLKDGDIVFALYEDHMILRRFYSSGQQNSVCLKADSDLLGKEIFAKNEVKIVGKLVGKYTKY